MPLLMRFLVGYTNGPNWFSLHIFHGFDLPPGLLAGRAIALGVSTERQAATAFRLILLETSQPE
jgi:hypothetical protein